jgi:hypothetical protein
LGIQVIVLAALAAVVLFGARLQDFDTGALHVTHKPRTVGAGRFNADAHKLPERSHPGEHLLVAVPGSGEALVSENTIMFVDHSSDMKILMCVDAADYAANSHFLTRFHYNFPSWTPMGMVLSRPNAWTGQ